jgi:Tfp pilus assembly protein PilO
LFKRILAAAIIIFIAFAYVQWGMDYIYAYEWDKTAEVRDSLANQIQNTKKIIDQPVVFDESLTQKLGDLKSQIDLEKSKFPNSVYITDVVNDLLHLAVDTGIEIIPLHNGDWANAPKKGYQMYQIQLLVQGDIDNILNFVDQVERTMLYSINIEDLSVKGKAIGPDDSTAAESQSVQGYITVTVYKTA